MLSDEEIRASIKTLEMVQKISSQSYHHLMNKTDGGLYMPANPSILRIEADAENLLSEFDYINQKLIKENIIEVRAFPYNADIRTKLSILILRIPAILEILRAKLELISSDQQDTLNSLKSNLKKISEAFDPDYYDNLLIAIEEFESGHWLSSVLIAGRVVNSLIEMIPLAHEPNKDKKETILDMRLQYLADNHLLQKDDRGATKQMFIRTEKITRDLFSHKLQFKADAEEAMSVLGNTVQIMKIVSKLSISEV